jgi:hypothetical protein
MRPGTFEPAVAPLAAATTAARLAALAAALAAAALVAARRLLLAPAAPAATATTTTARAATARAARSDRGARDRLAGLAHGEAGHVVAHRQVVGDGGRGDHRGALARRGLRFVPAVVVGLGLGVPLGVDGVVPVGVIFGGRGDGVGLGVRLAAALAAAEEGLGRRGRGRGLARRAILVAVVVVVLHAARHDRVGLRDAVVGVVVVVVVVLGLRRDHGVVVVLHAGAAGVFRLGQRLGLGLDLAQARAVDGGRGLHRLGGGGRRGRVVVDLVLGRALLVRVVEGVLAAAGEVRLEVVGADQVLDVEERGALLPDVDERGLEAGEDACDLAEDDVAYGPGGRVPFSLEVKLGDDSVFDEGDAGLSDITRNDDDVLGHGGTSFPAARPMRARVRAGHGVSRAAHRNRHTRGGRGGRSKRRGGQLPGASRKVAGRMRGASVRPHPRESSERQMRHP